MKIWTCKIGEVEQAILDEMTPFGADTPMREAVEAAYRMVTGRESDFNFSGWAGELREGERAVVEDREPEYVKTEHALASVAVRARDLLQKLVDRSDVALGDMRPAMRALVMELRSITAAHPVSSEIGAPAPYVPTFERERKLIAALKRLIVLGGPHAIEHDHLTELGRGLQHADWLLAGIEAERAGAAPTSRQGEGLRPKYHRDVLDPEDIQLREEVWHDGLTTFWLTAQDHTASEAVRIVASLEGPFDDHITVTRVACRVERGGEVSAGEWRLYVDPAGELECWEIDAQ